MMASICRHEFIKAFRSRWFVVAILIALALSVAAAVEPYLALKREETTMLSFGYGIGIDAHNYLGQTREGSFGNWVVVSANAPLFASLLLYALPLLSVMPYAWSYRTEDISGYAAQLCTRLERKKYIRAKYAATFATGSAVTGSALIVNFLAVSCLFPAYWPRIEEANYVGLFDGYIFSGLFYSQPYLYVIAYTLLDMLLMGVWAVVVSGLSLWIKDRVKLIALPYVMLFAWHYINGRVFDALQVQGFNINLLNSMRAESLLARPDIVATAIELLALFSLSIILHRRLAKRDVVS